MLYQIKRDATVIAEVYPQGSQKKKIMEVDVVDFAFTSPTAIDFQIGDTVTVHGEVYYLNYPPEPTMDSTQAYQYSMQFQAAYYDLAKPIFFTYNSANVLAPGAFEPIATASQLLDLIIANANRTQTGWTRGVCIDSEPKQLPFSGEKVLTALDQIAKAFDTEWWVVGKTIHLFKRGNVSGLHFEYGYDKGLRGGIQRTNEDTTSVFSRLYVTGGEDNLPSGYRGKNLALPLATFPGGYIQGPKYGKDEIEQPINFPDIKPDRVGTVTATADPFHFSDSGLDFDVNSFLVPGVSVKINFITGQLAGYTFEVAEGGYNHATRTFTILLNQAEKALTVPSTAIHAAVGDKWTISDIYPSPTMLANAEAALAIAGQDYFNKNAPAKVGYSVPPDPFKFRRDNTVLTLGDYVSVEVPQVGLNNSIRVYEYERDLHDEFLYSALKISNITLSSPFIRQIEEAEKVTKALQINKINDVQRARANWRTTSEIKTMLDTVQAEMLLITLPGASYQTNIISETNVGGNMNAFASTVGELVHEEYLVPGTWTVAAFSGTMPTSDAYWVYIKASRTNAFATITLTTTETAVESDPSYYYFPYGIISTPYIGKRFFTSTKGYTRITGNQINTGTIASNSSGMYINLDTGDIKGRFIFMNGQDVETNISTAKNDAISAAAADATLKAAAATSAAYADATTKSSNALTAANAFAESVAISKANVAQAAAITASANDAQTKADNAYSAAVSASNAYAATVADSEATAAEIAAAADASNKSTAAYNSAVAAAAAQYTALTASLRGLAYQDIVELAMLGSTVIENGKIKTVLLDAEYIRANIVNAAYIQALDIAATNLAATTGTIGGWVVNADSITSPYSGDLTAYKGMTLSKDGEIDMSSYSVGYKWDPDLKIWVVDPSSGSVIGSKIGPKGIEIKTNTPVVASFKQMSNAGAVALQAEAPPGSYAANYIGKVRMRIPHRDYPNDPAWERDCFLAWYNRDGVEQVEFIDIVPWTAP